MTALQIVLNIGVVIGILMFATSWLIRRKKITEGPLARAEKPLMLAGAGVTFVFALIGFTQF